MNNENNLSIQSTICKDLQNNFVVADLKCKLVESKIQFVKIRKRCSEFALPSALICIAFYSGRKLREPLLFVEVT